ncbi:MAG TPA: D-alanyl-D-alanine carboxypeptidase/D-alanyl-D-alanine-endopeptidase, partial [Bacteroidota bacterium]
MKIILTAATALLIFGGCAGLFPPSIPRDPLERLRYDIDQLLNDSLFLPARISMKVTSLETDEVLYERNSNMLMHPASNMKLLTSSAGIGILGKDFRFNTTVLIDTPMVSDTVTGNLYFKGFGNPDFKSSDLDTLVAQIKSAGINTILGDVISDVSYFDDLFWGEGWMWDDEPYEFEAFITPLSINDNCVRITVTPGFYTGDTALVTIVPNTSYVSLMNEATTVTDTALIPLQVTRLFKERLNTIVTDGQMLAGSQTREFVLSVWKPEIYAS